jgi:hypothetical protein
MLLLAICNLTNPTPFLAISYRRAGPAKQLCDSVGQSEILFTSCANFCAVKAAEEFQPRWGGIIRDVLMGMSTGGEKVQFQFIDCDGHTQLYFSTTSTVIYVAVAAV